jgi:hypothetical protein
MLVAELCGFANAHEVAQASAASPFLGRRQCCRDAHGAQTPQRGGRVRQIHKDEPPDHGIGLLLRETASSSTASNRTEACTVAPTRNIDRLGGSADAEHRAGEQGHITDSASDIEHVHARRQAGTSQRVLRKVAKERALPFLPFEFCFRVTK